MNKIILIGHLARDIEIRYLPTGTAVAKTNIAVNTNYKDKNGEKKQEVLFIDLDIFGRSAEIFNQYLHKGSKVLVEGRLKLDTWEKDGVKHYKHSVLVEKFEFLETRDPASESAQATNQTAKPTTTKKDVVIEETYGDEEPPF